MNFIVDLLKRIPPDSRETLLRILLVVLILILSWLLRRVLIWLVTKPIKRAVTRTGMQWDHALASTIEQPSRLVLFGIWLFTTAHILEIDSTIVVFVDNLSRSLFILAVFIVLFKMINILAYSTQRVAELTSMHIDDQLLPFIRTVFQLILSILAAALMIEVWGYDVAGIVTGLGIGGLAIALAAQETLSNLFGFGMVVSDNPFTIGDYIVTPDATGIVEKVGWRSTRIRQLDQAIVTIPNSTIANSAITNWSRLSKRWIDIEFGVTYSTTADQMEELLERGQDMLIQREHVDSDTIQIIFKELGTSSLDVLVRCYIDLSDWYDWMKEKEKINLELMRLIADMGLIIALPSRSVYIESVPSGWQTSHMLTNGKDT